MNVSLTVELEKLVENKVKTGRYQSASEVIREGLRLLDDQDQLHEIEIEEVRKKIRRGLDQLDRGDGIPVHQVISEIKKRSAEVRKKNTQK